MTTPAQMTDEYRALLEKVWAGTDYLTTARMQRRLRYLKAVKTVQDAMKVEVAA